MCMCSFVFRTSVAIGARRREAQKTFPLSPSFLRMNSSLMHPLYDTESGLGRAGWGW